MASCSRSIPRLALLTGILLTTSPLLSTPPAPARPAAALPAAHARIDLLRPPEVRLRKLHLVRPDLIFYPIEFEVDC